MNHPTFSHLPTSPVFIEFLPDESPNFIHKVGESVNEWEKVGNYVYFWIGENAPMLNLLGEHPCRIDAKGRLMFPAKLRKQLDGVIHHGLVVNRDIFEGCLVLYPKPEWDKVNAEMARLSRYNRKHQLFQRKFMKGATHVDLDGSGRINLPTALLAYAGINPKDANEVIVSGLGEKVEIWNQDAYNKQVIQDGDDLDFGDLAEDVRKDLDGTDAE